VPETSGLIQILRKPPAIEVERCDMCGAGIAGDHGHLVNLFTRSLMCVCRPCYLLFTQTGAGGARFRAVPQRYERIPAFGDAGAYWEGLDVPIGLAFFFQNSATGRVNAFYPSPAGATESELPLDAWNALVQLAPVLSTMLPDVEALLVKNEIALIVPIDACYELVGRIRRAWRGIQGGDEVWREIDEFFARASEKARSAA
jgi:hypothetical protein